MTTITSATAPDARTNEIFNELYSNTLIRTDRMFGYLMIFQWLGGIICALVISPRAWSGATSSIHIHVWAAIFLGGVLNLIPAAMGFLYSGRAMTRYVICISQMLAGALLIHLSGGRIETHFHVFGSLAFLAFYRDWRVLVVASAVVAADHFLRGVYWPQSVYAIATPEKWRWLEHTAWVIFEDIFLAIACVIGVNDLHSISSRQASLEENNQNINQLRQIAEKASQSKSLFLANMSHEIRTPLGAILGFSQLLNERDIDSTSRATYLQMINKNGNALARIIDDILDLSKVEAGKLEIEQIEFSLAELLDDVAISLSVRSSEKDITLTFEKTGIEDRMQSDPTRFRQILVNIIGNAVKFTQAGWVKVKVETKTIAEKVLVTVYVEDTGRGLHPHEQDKLFQPFSQADASTTRKFGGTGLGLVLSRKLAQNLGGDLKLFSSEFGRGSTFKIEILADAVNKYKPREECPEPRRGATARRKELQGKKILIAEDTSDNQILLKHILKLNGAEVSVAENGREALEIASRDAFDLILMDIQMPEMDGYQATEKIRVSGFTKPIIALTASALQGERERCLDSGCSDHIAKPIDSEKLLQTISKHLDADI